MHLSIGSTIRVSDPTAEIVQLCKNTLTIKNPVYAKKARMGFWIGDTPKTLTLYEKDGDDLILPYGTRRAFARIREEQERLVFFIQPLHELFDIRKQSVAVIYDTVHITYKSFFRF